MRIKQNGNKRDIIACTIYNDEATSTIGLGQPVVMSFSGTNDGVAVVLPATAADKKQTSLGFGVSLGSYAPKAFGESQMFGMCQNVMLLRTRATSTDPYVSIDVGAILKAESVSNSWVTSASVGASNYTPNAVIASSLAAIATTAISTSTTTGFTSQAVCFLRML